MSRGVMYDPRQVRKWIKERGTNLPRIVEATGLSYSALARWQADRGHPTRAELETLAGHLGVHPVDLVCVESYTESSRRATRARNWRVRDEVDRWLGPDLGVSPQGDLPTQAQRWAQAVERRRATLAASRTHPAP